jgi:hypothetical protein
MSETAVVGVATTEAKDCRDLIPQALKTVWDNNTVVKYFMGKIKEAIKNSDLRTALITYNKLLRFVTECNVPAGHVTKQALSEIATAFNIRQGDAMRQSEELDAETPGIEAIINEAAEAIKKHALYPLGLDELVGSIITVADEGNAYTIIMKLRDPATGEERSIEVGISKRELSRALEDPDYDVGGKVKRLEDPEAHVPRILEGRLIDFAIAHYIPRGFTSHEFAIALTDVMRTRLITRSRIDEAKLILIKWLITRVYTNIAFDKDGTRIATVRSVPPTHAIYILRSENLLLVPPQAYLPNADASTQQRITNLLKTMGILKDRRGHYPIHINDSIILEWFYVFDLAGLESFLEYNVESLARPDGASLLINQSVIEELRREIEVGDHAS